MKVLLFAVLIPLVAALQVKLFRAGFNKQGYELYAGYEKVPFPPSDIAKSCKDLDPTLLPGVIDSKATNDRIVAVTPVAEAKLHAKIPYFQLGLYAQDQQLKWFDESVPSNFSGLPAGTQIPDGTAYFALDPHGTDGRQPGEWFVLPAGEEVHVFLCGGSE
ncbi:unnamed protein product [Bursaphelenchus xylophilus]|uniref:(pine wood nematode) hypothetical protein n=1 Tax=Bursaphelenchus xylophilus TaxID=6326 RepID=A0A1I7SEJ4_BURXY|nr:unnamed protein product [Bursaphelenchus xylophilus]CAG9113562.1 unnamed protein product [Bursaphelenchus xylophilus]